MKKIGIIGGSESGVGAALLALHKGYIPFVSDGGQIKDVYKEILVKNEIVFEEGVHSLEKLSNQDVIVKSPGVPNSSPVMKHLIGLGLEIVSEIEFGFRHYGGKLLAITGSNGKTTTSGLLYHVLKTAGLDVAIAGNYGNSFAGLLAEQQPAYLVLEISSFQLDEVIHFKPFVAALLNITPDHLDRYEYKFENYIASKFRIIMNQAEGDHFFYNASDEVITSNFDKYAFKGTAHGIAANELNAGVKKLNGEVFDLKLKGKHNYFNASTVVAIARLIGLTDEAIEAGLSTFENVEHRLETVKIIEGVEYINDSKATNVDAVYYALDAMDKPIHWIAGGVDKGNDYEVLKPLASQKVKTLICLGIDNKKLKEAFTGIIQDIQETTKVTEVVQIAKKVAKEGEVVLLSPACASFDLFKNYMDRGDQFRTAVNEISI